MKKDYNKSSNDCVSSYATAYGNTTSPISGTSLDYYKVNTDLTPNSIGSYTYSYAPIYSNYVPDIKIMQKGEKIIFYFFKDSNIYYAIYDGDSVGSFKSSNNLLFLEKIL